MLYFVMGFLFAIAIVVIAIVIANDPACSKKDYDDKFQMYYSKGEGMNSRLWSDESKKVIRGPMADDMYRWIMGNAVNEEQDD